MTVRLPRTLLAWCYLWLLIAPVWVAQPGALRLGAEGPVRIAADAAGSERAVRVHKSEIQARPAARTGAANGSDSAPDAGTPATGAPATEFTVTAPRAANAEAPLAGFLTQRTRHPRAPPA